MSDLQHLFLKESEQKAFDLEHRKILNYNISRYITAVDEGKKQYKDLQLAKDRAARIKRNVINNLEEYLMEFESNFIKNGGTIIWADDAKEAISEILQIADKHQVKKVVKSKSMVTEEIELNKHLQAYGIESLETDLGEYIVQLADEKPYHIVTPAMHKSKEDISLLYHEKFNTPLEYKPEELTEFTRHKLRKKFMEADMGITGGNFLIADIGGVALTENEGNAALSMSMPKVHVAIVGLEKIIPSFRDLDLFWSLLSTYGTGQKATVYNSIVTGPRQENETDGPEHMYVVLLDNGRTNLLEQKEQKEALSCIRCGACLNVCPVYKNIGGHTYNSVYSGPIGSIIMPHLQGFENYQHLSFASTLCGRCTEECPVNIPIHELLLYNRRDAVKKGHTDKNFNRIMKAYKIAMKKRWIMETFKPNIKNMGMKLAFKKTWGPRRELPEFKESFNTKWKKERLFK